jgi:DNA invertase Pin-like site-specific DNA recombinase
MKTAISYVRWSSGRQSHGESLERQLSKTKEFCATHGLTLDLELVDAEKSAYKAKHTAKGGKLAKFLEDLENGLVPKGVTLIVESLDRLSRATVPIALRQFLQIIEHDVDIVTLIDGSWYSRKSLGDDSTPLLISIVQMMRAHDESKNKAYRLGRLWGGKRKRAIESKTPMTSICPAWLKLSADRKSYEVRPDRVKKVKLMFWLWNRGWSRQRIAKLFNTHEVPTWGKRKRRTYGWHHSYVDKVLHARAVLGEFVPHSTKNPKDEMELAGPRKPVSGAIIGYYPAIIPEAIFYRAEARRSGPRGPIGHKISNLFQGLLKDGENLLKTGEGMTMYYRDHGHNWQYVVSDLRRVNPKAAIFSWPYAELENLILKYIVDLDWGTLTVSKAHEVKALRDKLDEADGRLKSLNKETEGLLELAKLASNIPELAAKVKGIEAERTELRKTASELRSAIKSKENFIASDSQELIRQLASSKGVDNRLRLRNAIRQNIKVIELFRQAPIEMVPKQSKDRLADQMRRNRAIKLTFSNGAVRWITAREERDARMDGTLAAQHEIVQDSIGGIVQDKRSSKPLPPIQKVKRFKAPATITKAILERAREKGKK